MLRYIQMIIYLTIIVFVIGCAFDLAHISSAPVALTPDIGMEKNIQILEETEINNAPCGYKRKLNRNSIWKFIGNIPEGEVYKPTNQIFTIECSNIFEAYLVVSEDNLVGFYLPVQKEFVSLSRSIELLIK